MLIKNGVLPFCNPGTGEQFGSVPMTTEAEIAQAMAHLRTTFPVWKKKTPKERARVLKKLQEKLIDYADEIAAVINQDNGKSRQSAMSEVFLVADKLNSYRKHAHRWLKPEPVPPGLYNFKRYYSRPEPYGVVAVIGPWNYPIDLTIPPVFAALLAGNTVILKPSEVTAATGVLIEKLFQSVPELAPFVRVIHGDGSVGAALVQSGPDLVFLTGSTNTGRKVAQATAELMIPFICELGGKDPMLVLEDADIQEAARWGAWGSFFNAGQNCIAVERMYVVEAVYEKFLQAFLEETRNYTVGYSMEKENPYNFGPLTFDRQVNIVDDHLQDALDKGAQIALGGQRNGMFMEPTILTHVHHGMKIMQEETFGPVVPVMKVKDEAEAVQLANHSRFGLSACVWSRDLQRAERIAEQLEVGSVVVNDTIAHYAVALMPFGGMKESGNARTHGKYDVRQFTRTKAFGIAHKPYAADVATIVRKPNRYYVMSAMVHMLFGVTLRQRLRMIPELAQQAKMETPKPKPGRVLVSAGAFAALSALVFGLFRVHKDR